MSVEILYLDCCKKPVLEVKKSISTDAHDLRKLYLCSNCGSYWFNRFYEHIYFNVDLPDSQIEWYVKVSKQEAQSIVSKKNALNLAERRCFHVHEGIVSITEYPPF